VVVVETAIVVVVTGVGADVGIGDGTAGVGDGTGVEPGRASGRDAETFPASVLLTR
jgi:hypothetical protein